MEKELRINLNTVADLKGIDSIKRSFSELERESLRAASSQRSISSATSDASRSVDHLSERIGFMGHAYVGFQAVMAGSSYMTDLTKDAIRQADTWNLLEGRLRLVTDSTQQLVSVQANLFDISQLTRSSYESTTNLYTNLATSMGQMGKSQEEILRTTQTVNEAIAISGSNTQEAAAAMQQLGQAFGSGKLQGDELKSILENAKGLAQAIADGMGVPIGKLKDLGAEGKITSEVLATALAKMAGEMDSKFSKLPETVGQSTMKLQNQIGLTIHEFDQMHGVTKSISEAINDVTKTLSEHGDQIGDYVSYVGTAVAAIIAWKVGTVALNSAQKLHDAYVAASTVSTTAYSIATNTTTTSVTTLTARQVAANAALGAWNRLIAVNPYVIAGAAIIGVGLILKNQADEMRESVRRTAVDVENLSAKALQAKVTYETMQLDAVNKSISDPSVMKSLFGNERIDLHRKAQIEQNLRAYGSQLQKLHEEANKPLSGSGKPTTNLPTEKELKSAAKAAEEYAKNYKSLQDTVFNIGASDHDKAIKQIEDQAKVWRDQKLPEIEITKYVSEAKTALNRKELDELGKMMTSARQEKEKEWKESDEKDTQATFDRWSKSKDALIMYYDAIGNTSDKFAIEESEKMQKLAEAGILSNQQMLAIWAKDNEEFQKSEFEKNNAGMISFFNDIHEAMNNQIFDAMVGKWNSFGDWLKDFWGSLTTSIARAASSQLSNALIGGIQNFVIGSPGQSSGLARLLTGAVGVGATLSADEIAQLGGTAGTAFTTGGGTAVDAAGQITATGSDIMSIASSVSSLKTAYDVLSGGLSASISDAFASGASTIYNLTGSSSLAGGIGNFGAGIANPFTDFGVSSSWAQGAGSMLGGAAIGGLGGYAIGSLGDMLFGANTKAGTYGAIGGAVGSLAGPIGAIAGAALGSLIGGLFGTTKKVDSGLYFQNDTTSTKGLNSIENYLDTEKKSWFGDGANSDYSAITDSQKRSIEGIFKSYDYLLTQLGSTKNIVLKASRYTAETFQDEIAKGFISTYMGIEQHASEYLYSRNGLVYKKYNDTEEMTKIYNMWSEYAKSVDKTVMQALTDSVNTFIQSTRDFTVWELERSGNTTEALRQKAQWLQSDFQNLESMMGVTGVTVENFTSLYEDAIKSSLDPTTITQWQSLGSALQSATDAQDAYNKSLTDSALSNFNTLASSYSALSTTITNVQGMIDEINGVTMTLDKAGYDPDKIMQAYNAQTAAITAQHTTRLDALNTEMESIKKIADYSKTLKNSAQSLRYSALTDNAKFEYSTSTLNALISSATGKLSTGTDIADEVSRITDLSGNYAQLAQGYYATQAEYDYAIGAMANKIEALGGSGGSHSDLSDIEAAILAETDSTTAALDALKSESIYRLQSIIDTTSNAQQGIADQLNSMLDGYTTFWGDGSPIIEQLKAILSAIGMQYKIPTTGSGSGSNNSVISSTYDSILGRTPDAGGATFWDSKISSGDLSISNIGTAIGAAAVSNGEISTAQYVADLYTQGLGRAPDDSGLAYWTNAVNSGQLSVDQLASTFSSSALTNGETFHPFGDGGIVTKPTLALIGERGYPEIKNDSGVIPLKNPNDPLGGQAIVAELKALREEVAKLREENNQYAKQTAQNTKPSRYE